MEFCNFCNLQGSHLDNFPLKTLKLGRVAFNISVEMFRFSI